MAYTLPSIHGRQDFPAPNPSDRVAPLSFKDTLSLNLAQAPHNQMQKQAVLRSAETALAQDMPTPPARDFPTVGQVDKLGPSAFLPAMAHTDHFSSTNPQSIYALNRDSKIEGGRRARLQRFRDNRK